MFRTNMPKKVNYIVKNQHFLALSSAPAKEQFINVKKVIVELFYPKKVGNGNKSFVP